MVVNLYTARIVLEALGVVDFGMYNAIGGFIASFSIISSAISSAISRYITFSLGQNDFVKANKVFCTSIIILLLFSCIIVLGAETFGLWFLNTKMTIPNDSYLAANWVYQFSLITFVLNLMSIPYSSLIIAHEKMDIYAYMGILEGGANLLIAFIVKINENNKLTIYAALICLTAFIVRIVYGVFCKYKFEESKFRLRFDKYLVLELFKFTGWTFIGTTSGVLRNQGINILYNIFYGPVVNAAYGLSSQVFNAINKFSDNFYTAVQPQITKSFASGNKKGSFYLVSRSCRMAYFLLLLISIPLLCHTKLFISFWLNEIPEGTLTFTKIMIVFCLIEAFSQPLIYLVLANGIIKKYQLIVGGVNLLNFPFAWVLLYLGFQPAMVQCSILLFALICLFLRLGILKTLIKFPVKRFIKETLIKSSVTTLIIFVMVLLVNKFMSSEGPVLYQIINLVVLEVTSSFIIYYIGLTRNERKFINSKIWRR